MKQKPKVKYKGYEWTVAEVGGWSVLLEREGKERAIQDIMPIEEYNNTPAAKPEPKYDPNKETRLMYGNECIQTWTTLKQVMMIRETLQRRDTYRKQKFIIEQR